MMWKRNSEIDTSHLVRADDLIKSVCVPPADARCGVQIGGKKAAEVESNE